ncbi:hypothetical protein LV779_34220 [Streptomyces thinghirensis]|nr:hypothetical protein [Streptomyces thinghirensis]
MSSLAELSRVTPSHLSRIASRLERQGLARARAGPLGRPRHDRIADRGGVAEVRAGGARVLRDPARTPLRPTHRGAGQATRWDRCAHRAVPRPRAD